MSEYQEPVVHTAGTPRWVALAVAIVAGLSLIGLGGAAGQIGKECDGYRRGHEFMQQFKALCHNFIGEEDDAG